MNTLGKIIRTRLKVLKKSQAWLAWEIGSSTAAVSNWCNDRAKPKVKFIRPLADKLLLSVDDVLKWVK